MIKNKILEALSPQVHSWIHRLECFFALESTNTFLINQSPPPFSKANICLAESQSAARGRSGAQWITYPGRATACSLAFWSHRPIQELSALPLCMGIAVAQALESLGLSPVQLKWPNDIWLHSAKLGGILTEIPARNAKASLIVLGLGVNESLTTTECQGFSYPITDIKTHLSVEQLAQWSREKWLATLLHFLYENILLFETEGLSAFYSQWDRYDILRDRLISAIAPTGKLVQAKAIGITKEGFLRVLSNEGKEEHIHDATIRF